MPRAIADPGTTAIWEQALDMVQSGEMSLEDFVAKQSAWMSKQVERCAGLNLTISGPALPRTPWKKKRKSNAGAGKRVRASSRGKPAPTASR
ncbi:DNA topoisomerase III [compost metagenome]